MSDWAAPLKRFRLAPDVLRPLPCMPALYFFLAASLPVGMLTLGYCRGLAAIGLGVGMLAAGLLVLPRSHWRFAWWAALGLLVAGLHAAAPWRTYRRQLLGREEAFAEIEAVVTETCLPNDPSLEWLIPSRGVEAKLRRMRLSRSEPWQDCRGKILLRKTEGLSYGQTIRARGSLERPWVTSTPSTFNYRSYLRTQGMEHMFYARSMEVVDGRARGRRRALAGALRLREHLLLRLIRQVGSAEDQQMLAAMTLGFRQGLESSRRELYLQSGMVHLFAVSGLHVGILFLLIMGSMTALRVPFRARHFLGPLVLLLYVLAAGAAPSAMRAWLMLSVWSMGRALKAPTVPVNAVLAAALALLLYNPLGLFQLGFQFSFIVVLALIWGWRLGGQLIVYLFEHRLWTRSSRRPGWRQGDWGGRMLLQALASMACAWLGGLGLTAYYNCLFIPGSILVNIAAGLLAWLVFLLAAAKLAFSFLFWAGPELLLARGLSALLFTIRLLAETCSSYGGVAAIARPSLLLTICYYALVLVFFASFRGLRRVFASGLALGVCIVVVAGGGMVAPSRPAVSIFVPAGDILPVLLVRPPWQRRPVLVNLGSRRSAFALNEWLRTEGHAELQSVVCLDNRIAYTGGGERVLAAHRVDTVAVMAETHHNLKQLRLATLANGARWREWRGQSSVGVGAVTVDKQHSRGERRYVVLADWPGWGTLRIEVLVLANQKSVVTIEGSGGGARSQEFVYADRNRVVDVPAAWLGP